MLTAFDKLRLEGRQKGRQEGHQEGRQEGLQDALVDVLAARFQPLPADLETKIHQIRDSARLNGLLRRAATVSSLEDIAPSFDE